MSTNKAISTDNTLGLKVLSFSSQIPGYEKIKISAQKMEISPEKLTMPKSEGGLQPPSLYTYATDWENFALTWTSNLKK